MSIYTNRKFTPCDFITEYSGEVWEKLKKVNISAGNPQMMKYDETSITQELIYLFQKFTHSSKFHLYENRIERTSGADIELRIISNRTNLGYHAYIQSKRVYSPNQDYRALNSAHGRTQVDRLINYVNTTTPGAVPLYLFYNYHNDTNCNRNPNDFGLTIAPAAGIKSKFGTLTGTNLTGWNNVPNFELFHLSNPRFCKPFYSLFCPGILKSQFYGIPFPMSLPFYFLNSLDITDVMRDFRLSQLFDDVNLREITEAITKRDYGVVDSTNLKKELIKNGVKLSIDTNLDKSLDGIIKFGIGDESQWLKGYSKIGKEGLNSEFETKDEFEEDFEPKARYKMVLIID